MWVDYLLFYLTFVYFFIICRSHMYHLLILFNYYILSTVFLIIYFFCKKAIQSNPKWTLNLGYIMRWEKEYSWTRRLV